MPAGARHELFLAALEPSAREAAAAVPELASRVSRLVDAARQAWPTLAVDDAVFIAYVAERVPGDAVGDELEGLRAADLYLACACRRGDAAALRAFEERYLREVDAALARTGLDGADEVKQQLRIKLFTAEPGDQPRIAEYSGRGDLRSWLRVTAVRAALNTLRRERREVPSDDEHLFDGVVPGDDPELAVIKDRYRTEFRQAVRDAIGELEPRERNLLRHYYLDGLTCLELSRLYGVHLATGARWLDKARHALYTRTRKRLMQRLGVDRSELDSILRLIDSQLEASAVELLQAS